MAANIEAPPSAQQNEDIALQLLAQERKYLAQLDHTYPYWSKLKYTARADGYEPSHIWQALKITREATRFELAWEDTFYFNLPNAIQRSLHEIDMHCGGSLNSIVDKPISEGQKAAFILSSLRTEAYHSSVLEGAVATKERAKEIIVANRKPKTEGEKMIYNNYRAMEYILENKTEKLTLTAIYALHEILTKDTLETDKVGRFRNSEESIDVVDVLAGEIIYTPPPAANSIF
jgi:Fic family protein